MRFYHLKLERVGGEGATPPPPSCLVVIVLLIVILHPPFQSPMIFTNFCEILQNSELTVECPEAAMACKRHAFRCA